MAGFFIPDPRFEMPSLLDPGRKPVGPVEIDWDHPLAKKILHYFLHQNSAGIDLATQQRLTVTAPTRRGGLAIDSTSNYMLNSTQPAISAGMSLMHVYTPTVNTTTNRYLSDFGGSNEFAIIAGYQNNNYNLFGGSYPISGNASNSQMPMSGVGITDALCYTVNSDFTNLTGYVNGIEYVNANPNSGDLEASQGFRIGSSWGGGSAAIGIFDATIIFHALTANEVKGITQDPYQVLIPA
jgi:hypothetical protein